MKADAYLRSYILEEKDKIHFPGNMCSCIATLKVLCVSCVANYIQRTYGTDNVSTGHVSFLKSRGVHGTQDTQPLLNGTHH